MRKFLSFVIIVILMVPMFLLSFPETKASPGLTPFTPHEAKVLVVSPADPYYSGANYLVADLARYGFNITHHASNNATATNYLTDPKTSDLSQYDVVIIHGILGFSTSRMSAQEVAHFTDYRGILIVIGNALFQNETSGTWWDNVFSSAPVQRIEQRLGVDFTGFLGGGGAWHNSGTFTLKDNSIKGLPVSLSYVSPFKFNGSISFQLDLTTNGASTVYDFTITSSPSLPLVGKTTRGVTFYRAGDGAVGIYIQGSYIYATSPGINQINYFGLTDTSKRSALLASLIAYALEKDIDTIIKPQPLASIRLDGVGQYYLQTEAYLNASLYNFNSVLDAYNITPTIGFIDFLDFKPDYWQTVASKILSQLKGKYRDWEYSTNLRYYTDPRLMTKEQIASLLYNIQGNYSMLGMDLFSTVIAPIKGWNQSTLDAMVGKDLHLIDILDIYYSDWWRLRINSSVIVHSGAEMLPERVWPGPDLAENFTQKGLDKNSIHYKYFSRRDKFALATVNGFVGFVYYVPNFRRNEVGTYSLRTVYENLTSEIPDIRFVPLMEAGLYFGNKWMRIENASRVGPVIEFDVDTSAIPSVVGIGKGMLWLRINANESVQGVSIDNNPWFYFDEHSIRIPAPMNSSHVKVTLGESLSPRVVGSRYKVVEARYDGYRFYVSVSSAQDLNVSVRLFLPQVGPFRNASWSVFSLEAEWRYSFDPVSRILEFWAISDNFVTFEAGIFWSIEQTPPWYNSSVTITVNITGLKTDVHEVTLSYYVSNKWSNITMTPTDGLWTAKIPAVSYGSVVQYKMLISDVAGRWLVTGIYSYNVIDETPPEVGVPTWDPLSPVAGEPVLVEVSATEPENASGVQRVVLWYYTDGPPMLGMARAKSINMTQENDGWSAIVPGQSGGVSISFFMLAYDKAGNVKQTSNYSYRVATSPLSSFQIMLLGIGIVVGIGIILYFVKFKKSKR